MIFSWIFGKYNSVLRDLVDFDVLKANDLLPSVILLKCLYREKWNRETNIKTR